MTWIIQQWPLVSGTLLFVILLVVFTRESTFKHTIAQKERLHKEIIIQKTSDLVDNLTDNRYTPEDCRKIALTMMKLVGAQNHDIKDLFFNKNVLIDNLKKTIALLTICGEVEPR